MNEGQVFTYQIQITPERLFKCSLPKTKPVSRDNTDLKAAINLIKNFEVNWTLLGPHIEFDVRAYLRKRIYQDADWEMLLLCWLPGQKTLIHDHGGSKGVSVVMSGELTEVRYNWKGHGSKLSKKGTRSLKKSDFAVEYNDTIHMVENRGGVPAISLHLYSPPLLIFNAFEGETGYRYPVRL